MSTTRFFRLFGLLAGLLLGVEGYAQTFTWVQPGYTSKEGNVNGMTVANGTIIATGEFRKQLSFGSQTLTEPVGYRASFTGSFSTATGSPVWLKKNLNPQSSNTIVQGWQCCADAAGNSYVTYYIADNVYFDQTLVTASSPTVVVVKYTAAGAVVWAKTFRTNLGVLPAGLSLGKNNTFYLALNFVGQLTFGSTTLTSISTSVQAPDGLLLNLADTGNIIWTKQLPGSNSQTIGGISADVAGNLLVAGRFYNQITFSPTVSFSGIGGYLFIAKYSDTGQFQWARRMGSENNDQILSITTDGNGDVAFCG